MSSSFIHIPPGTVPVPAGTVQPSVMQPAAIEPAVLSAETHAVSGGEVGVEVAQVRWYAVYTCANHEKRVQKQLEQRSVESFLPLYEEWRRWKDRRTLLKLPVFPSYVFVRLALRDRLRVLQTPGVVRLVGFNGDPVPLPEDDIEALRTAWDGRWSLQPHPYLTVGRRVRIKRGPLKGMEGILLRRKNVSRVVLSIPLIAQSASVEIDMACLEPIGWRRSQERPSNPV